MAGHRGSHRHQASERRRKLVVSAVVLLVAVGGWVVVRTAFAGGCGSSDDVTLSVAVSPELVGPVRATAESWSAGAAGPDGECVRVEVVAARSADVATAIATAYQANVRGMTAKTAVNGTATNTATADVTATAVSPSAGVKPASGVSSSWVPSEPGKAGLPDAWIPDSSAWLVRLRSAGKGLVPDRAASLATSPVVLAVPEPLAMAMGWPDKAPTWESLLQRLTSGEGPKVGIVDPTTDASGLSGLMAFGAVAKASGREETTVAAMRALVAGRTAAPEELLRRFPQSPEASALAKALGAAPVSESALLAYNAARPAVPLAALYPTPAPSALDFPFAALAGDDPRRSALLTGLGEALTGVGFGDQLAGAGLRRPDGSARFELPAGAPARVEPATLDQKAVATAVATWISVTMPARMLAVIDVSGSMLTPVPTAGGATRGQISVAAAKQGLTLFDDAWSVGLWTFSTNLDGANDYRELVPIGPMSTTRAKLLQAIGSVTPKEGGETGLYDTVLAAYQRVQEGWDPNAVNSVVIMTDGINRDDNGLTLPQLLARLKQIVDPARPIQVIPIGIGDQVSAAELRQIVGATGGGVFLARDPSAIGEIFLKAIALRPAVAS